MTDGCNILGNVIGGEKGNVQSTVWQVALLNREKNIFKKWRLSSICSSLINRTPMSFAQWRVEN